MFICLALRFSITLERKGRMAIGLNSLFDLGIGMIFDRFHLSGNEDIFNTELNNWVKYGKSLGNKAFKNKGSKSSEPIAFDFTEYKHSKTSSWLTQRKLKGFSNGTKQRSLYMLLAGVGTLILANLYLRPFTSTSGVLWYFIPIPTSRITLHLVLLSNAKAHFLPCATIQSCKIDTFKITVCKMPVLRTRRQIIS